MSRFISRRLLVRAHLVVGLAAGLLLLFLATTGTLLALERPVLAWLERDLRHVTVPATPALPLDVITLRVARATGTWPTALTVSADPADSLSFTFGRGRTLYVNPYTGDVIGPARNDVSAFFRDVNNLHRWFALEGAWKEAGKQVTGAATLALLALATSGLYLWWPRGGSRGAFARAAGLGRPAGASAGTRQRHRTIGFWALPLLLNTSLTGVVLAYPWANDLLFTAVRSEQPADFRKLGGRPPELFSGGGNTAPRPFVDSAPSFWSPDASLAAVRQHAPRWENAVLRAPRTDTGLAIVTIEEAGSLNPHPVSKVVLEGTTGAVRQWEPYADLNAGRTVRAWIRPLHAGQVGGPLGFIASLLTASAVITLVLTGFALATERLRRRQPAPVPTESTTVPAL